MVETHVTFDHRLHTTETEEKKKNYKINLTAYKCGSTERSEHGPQMVGKAGIGFNKKDHSKRNS